MRTLIALLSLAALATLATLAGEAAAREVVLDLNPEALRARGGLRAEAHAVPGAAEELLLENRGAGEATLAVLDITPPAIGRPTYAIVGEVRHEGLASQAVLEMWSHFPGGNAFFSRTLGQGAMRPLRGTSAWREFVLPFFNSAGAPDPERLTLNVVFSSSGRVGLRSLRLVRFAAGESPLQAAGQWWDDRRAGLFGGVAGSLVGLLGAIIGVLAGAARARGFVFAALRALALLGGVALVLGVVAVSRAQPYAVFYPLLLIGGMSVAMGLWLPRNLRRRYEDAELRRMQAADLAR